MLCSLRKSATRGVFSLSRVIPVLRAHREGRTARAGQGQETGSSPEVVEVWLLTAEVVSLPLRALASGKLTPASRSGQKGSMANLQEVGTGSEGSPPRTLGGRALRWEGQLMEDRADWGRDDGGHASERCCVGLS